jgi:hypothetical protein
MAAWAAGLLLGIGVGGGVVVGMLLEQGEDELLPQVQGALLALVEGDEVAGEVFVEHQVEGGGGLCEEAAA